MTIGVGSRVAWLGHYESRTGSVVSMRCAVKGACVVEADDTGLVVTVPVSACTLLVDDHAQNVRSGSARTEVGS